MLPKYGKTVGGGHRGIACIALSFGNADDNDDVVDDGESEVMLTEQELSGDDFKKFVTVTPLPANVETPGPGSNLNAGQLCEYIKLCFLTRGCMFLFGPF